MTEKKMSKRLHSQLSLDLQPSRSGGVQLSPRASDSDTEKGKDTREEPMFKPYLTTQRGVLFDEDCLDVLPQIEEGTIDCVFADPPFNLGKDYKSKFDDDMEESVYFAWCHHWIAQSCRVLKDGGAIFIYATPELAVHFARFLNEIDDMQFRHWIAMTMKGTFRRGKKLYPAHYALLYYTKGAPRVFNNQRVPIPTCRHCGGDIKDYGGHRDKLNPKGLNLTDFWEDTSPNRHKKYKVRPGVNELKVMIPERAVLISTNEEELVLDPFGGGGSTYQAAEKNNRNWIGIELYDCDHIRTRMTEVFPHSVGEKPSFDYEEVFINEDN